MTVIVTGGAGYIGSAVAAVLTDAGLEVVVLDDLSVGRLRLVPQGVPTYVGDVADPALLHRLLRDHPDVDVVVHCAARTVVAESVSDPLSYYETNVAGTYALLRNLLDHGVHRVLFSSSAAVYAPGAGEVLDERAPMSPSSPYAATKVFVERALADLAAAGALTAVSLRYFNPVGADPALRTGPPQRDPAGVLGRLVTAHRTGQPFVVRGTDWPTRDGTGLRDYIHVWDLAEAHLGAVLLLSEDERPRHEVINLGSGRGCTVRELVDAFRAAGGAGLQVVDGPRRPGDVAGACSSGDKAREVLGWEPKRSLAAAVRSALAWDTVYDGVLHRGDETFPAGQQSLAPRVG